MKGFKISLIKRRLLFGSSTSSATTLLKNDVINFLAIRILLCSSTLAMLIRHGGVHAFQQGGTLTSILVSRRQTPSTTRIIPHRHHDNISQHQHQHNMILSSRDADLVEQLVGGERYSLVPMPDNMKPTTVFVGNLCEFVQDEDLSRFFAAASTHLSRVPATVVRKPDTQSLRYGFVSFPTRQEKEVGWIGCVCVCVYIFCATVVKRKETKAF